MRHIRVWLCVSILSSFMFLFLIIMIQGYRIERIEKQLVTAQIEQYELRTMCASLKNQITDSEEKYKRLTDQTMDFILNGGWQ